MRRAARVDKTHAEIVRALRAVGATVEPLTACGGGVPDLLVGYKRVTVLLENKSKGGRLNPLQQDWHARWRGGPLVVVWTVEEALRAIGVAV